MHQPLDEADREICAALLRNGRASWREIARVTGMQERTIARRGARLLEQGLVQVRGLSQPLLQERGISSFARIECAPKDLNRVATWFAGRPETLWVASLATESAVISECYLRDDSRAAFIEGELAQQPITNYSFSYLGRYRRTVRGWQPNILSTEQLDQLGENETRALLASLDERAAITPLPDETDREIVRLLRADGRLSIDAIAANVGVAKPTARRRIAQLQQADYLSIRAVIDPALLGFPLEASLTVEAPVARLDEIAALVADDWRTRWAAEVPGLGQVQALLTLESHVELHETLRRLDARLGDTATRITASPILSHFKRSDVLVSHGTPRPEEAAAG
ncbi:Lrp/AsnC family transcriptional regulator [Leucobacter luti]|uniref:AsnC family transcriptional regulator n=1 Tax=Leucobacter luti TaxID=340320 RepID=A0A4Q7TPN8_9MICO|nr:AsnC family transcriptional regulator [Leucobacter luti]MBL3699931.1 AsnC family transcriptional regulator [Leucobacter luti]RZT62751.1 AsnC family transcriptional regulator [Leucobacter luti]